MNEWHRLPSWVERLGMHVSENRFRPYEWGKHDCVMFAMDGIWAITGVDPIPEYHANPWHSKEEAMAILAAEGGLITAMNKRFPKRPNHQTFHRGDPVLIYDAEGQPSLGLCTGRSAHAPGGPGVDELLATPMSEAIMIWAVGF